MTWKTTGTSINRDKTDNITCVIVVLKTRTATVHLFSKVASTTYRYGNSNLVRFGMNVTTRQTRIPELFLTAQTVNPPRFLLHVPNESVADKHPTYIQIFCRKLRFRCQRILCIIFGVQDQVRYTVSWLH